MYRSEVACVVYRADIAVPRCLSVGDVGLPVVVPMADVVDAIHDGTMA